MLKRVDSNYLVCPMVTITEPLNFAVSLIVNSFAHGFIEGLLQSSLLGLTQAIVKTEEEVL